MTISLKLKRQGEKLARRKNQQKKFLKMLHSLEKKKKEMQES